MTTEIDFRTFAPDRRPNSAPGLDHSMPSVQHVVLDRVEGVPRADGSMPISAVRTLEAATTLLRDWSTTAPRGGAYDKVDFWVTWTDGEVYHGRHDLQHWTHPGADCDLGAQVIRFLRFVATARQDPARQPARVSPEEEAQARAWLTGRRFN